MGLSVLTQDAGFENWELMEISYLHKLVVMKVELSEPLSILR